jgi:hypothetical protein
MTLRARQHRDLAHAVQLRALIVTSLRAQQVTPQPSFTRRPSAKAYENPGSSVTQSQAPRRAP